MGSKLHVLAMSHIEHLCPAIGVVADVSSQVMHSAGRTVVSKTTRKRYRVSTEGTVDEEMASLNFFDARFSELNH